MDSIQLLPVGKGGLPSFLYPISYRIGSFCFHLKAQLKHPPSPHKEKEMKMKKIFHFKLSSVWTLRESQQGQSQKRPKGTKCSHRYRLHKAAALSTAQVGKDTRQCTGGGCLIQWGKRASKQASNPDGNSIIAGRRIFTQK